jgi:hypothetical protein
VTLLHPPYTVWHLSYVAIGAALAPRFHGGLLALTALAFFLALGVGAHALDELHGRPLGTRIPARMLVALAATTIAGAAGIGVGVAVTRNLWLVLFVAFSTPVREVRRRVAAVSGTILLEDGRSRTIDSGTLTGAPEQALRTLAAAVVTLAAALVTFRVT